MSNKRSKVLDISHGTVNRLRKMLLYNLLVRHSENICFKCGEIIDSVEELSVEHKIPWLNNNVALFWDLNNIIISHLVCDTHALDK